MAREIMNTREVADYLRISQRKLYALVKARKIPRARVTGKWIFPRHLIDQWVAQNTDYAALDFTARPPAPVVSGSHDPLLDHAIQHSGCGFGGHFRGSLNGLRWLATGEATLAGLHARDAKSGDYNVHLLRRAAGQGDVVLLEWARRRQGIVVAAGNPLKLRRLADLKKRRARVVLRQPDAGSHVLLLQLLDEQRLSLDDLTVVHPVVYTETELGLAISEGWADAGLAIEAAARRFKLDFVPLHEERFDLAVRRRSYFEPPVQALLRHARSRAFAREAAALGGYDISQLGRIVWNGK